MKNVEPAEGPFVFLHMSWGCLKAIASPRASIGKTILPSSNMAGRSTINVDEFLTAPPKKDF